MINKLAPRFDIKTLMDGIAQGRKSTYSRPFKISRNSFVLCDRNSGSGLLKLSLNWPARGVGFPSGIVEISYPPWNTLPRCILLTGIPNGQKGWFWRLLCPISRNLVQVVYYDDEAQLFVSAQELGRELPNSVARRLEHCTDLMIQFQEKFGNLENKPNRMSDIAFAVLKAAPDFLERSFLFATNGLPAPCMNDDGLVDVIAMSARSDRANDRSTSNYYLTTAGNLKLKARSKRRLGIV